MACTKFGRHAPHVLYAEWVWVFCTFLFFAIHVDFVCTG